MSNTVLIVDDSRVSRMMIRAIVLDAHPDWAILEAGNGDEAINVATGKSIQHMILDYNMPGMNGLELADTLIGSHPDAKLTLLTANVQDSIRNRAQEIGVEFVSKPITDEKIRGIIN